MEIQYPNNKKWVAKVEEKVTSSVSYDNRGMSLESDLNETHRYYITHGVAVIHKKPTPLQIVRVEYPKRSKAVIREAYFQQPSTTDYNGVYKGTYIDFEAKETRNKTSFPLQNIHEHQVKHMKDVAKQGGITFLIVKFSTLQQCFLLPFSVLNRFWTDMEAGGRKSIPIGTFQKEGFQIKIGYHPRIDYLKIIDKLM